MYAGGQSRSFELSDGVRRRYGAAMRGGVASTLALQGLAISAAAVLRTSWPYALTAGLLSVHLGMPCPMRLYYRVDVQRGWKGGTRIKFAGAEPGIDVIFEVEEGRHDRFERDRDDLITVVTVGVSRARSGGTIVIDLLDKKTRCP